MTANNPAKKSDMIFSEKKDIPISELGWLSLSTYPFSFKILFAPFLDAYYSQTFGKRKSYIIPLQYIVSLVFFLCSFNIQSLINDNYVKEIGLIGFIITFLVSLQDIAVDAWALKLLSKQNLNYASPLQSVGISIGWMLSSSLYLELVKYFGDIFDTDTYFRIIGIVFILITIYIHKYVEENYHHTEEQKLIEKQKKPKKQQSLKDIYKLFTQFYKNKNLRFLLSFLILRGLGFTPLTASFNIKLIKRGIAKEYISNINMMLTPLKLFLPIFAAKYLKKFLGLKLNIIFMYIHIIGQVLQYLIWQNSDYFKEETLTGTAILMGVFELLNILMSLTMMSRMSFYGKIAQEGIEGSYITCLTSIANLGFRLWTTGYLFINDYLSEDQDSLLIFLGWVFAFSSALYCKPTFEKFEKSNKAEWKLDNKIQPDDDKKEK